jgi:methylated-DNA-[protein]-cysteine S-methyltransferase
MFYATYESPIGLIEVGGTVEAVVSLYFVEEPHEGAQTHPLVDRAIEQLDAYFNHSLRRFDLPLDLQGTDFQRQVWKQLETIPYGQTVSYLEIAQALGKPKAVRAVGAANGQNPVSIIVPCHRVIGSNGDLIGYGGGLWRKEWLLRHEGALLV